MFHDLWLPSNGYFKLIAPLCFFHESLSVSNLIRDRQWRKEILEVLFHLQKRELILRILLCVARGPDELIWHYTWWSVFSVAFAYRLA